MYKDFYEFGLENFIIEKIIECEDYKSDDMEIYYINYYDSTNNGYNISLGGKGRKTIKYSDEEIIEKYLETKCVYKVCKSLKIDRSSINKILIRNNIDILKNKTPSGENNFKSKLTNNDVLFIKNNYIPRDKNFGARALGRKYNVNKSTITMIIHNKSWTHI